MCLFLGMTQARAQTAITAYDVKAERAEDSVRIQADVALSGNAKVATDCILSLTLRIVGQRDSVELPTVYVLGRLPYYRYARGRNLVTTTGDVIIRDKTMLRHTPYHYTRCVAYQPWMERAVVKVVTTERVCCTSHDRDVVHEFEGVGPNMVLKSNETTVDTIRGAISGTAYIIFPLDTITIHPEYLQNREQLGKILASLDSVRRDTTATLKQLTIKGYASPEGKYDHNDYLARERTASLKEFITKNFDVPRELIKTDYEAEDWAGLRNLLMQPNAARELPHRKELLEFVDSDLDPDEKELLMRTRYPEDFQVLLDHYLPYLRHSDYTIDYTWKKTVYTPGRVDTLYQMPTATGDVPKFSYPREKRFQPIFALKTNLLFDLALALNFEVEAQLGPDSRWSVMVEDWFPWYLYRRDFLGDTNKYRRPGEKAYKNAYEIWAIGTELRYWLTPRCLDIRPALTGSFVGAYVASGKYDWEWDSTGDQGEFISFGLTYGHSWVLSRHWNFEFSASAGYVRGPRRHYNGMFDNSRLIWQYTGHISYIGPTKLKLSLVWLLGPKKKTNHAK